MEFISAAADKSFSEIKIVEAIEEGELFNLVGILAMKKGLNCENIKCQ